MIEKLWNFHTVQNLQALWRYSRVYGDPNQKLLLQMAVTLEISIFDLPLVNGLGCIIKKVLQLETATFDLDHPVIH